MPITVDVDNYATAEVASQIDRFVGLGAAVNEWVHFRRPTPLDQQTVIRMNRDTLYSLAVVDISRGATLTVPDSGGRYLTVMVINEDGYLNRVFHEAGDHRSRSTSSTPDSCCWWRGRWPTPPTPTTSPRPTGSRTGWSSTPRRPAPWETGRFDEASYQAIKKPLLALGAPGSTTRPGPSGGGTRSTGSGS